MQSKVIKYSEHRILMPKSPNWSTFLTEDAPTGGFSNKTAKSRENGAALSMRPVFFRLVYNLFVLKFPPGGCNVPAYIVK